jgi:hypothetical protein
LVQASEGAARRLKGNLIGNPWPSYRRRRADARREVRHTAKAVTPTPTAEPTAPVTMSLPG